MKKNLIIALIAVLAIASIAWAASVPIFGQDPAYSQNFTLITTSTNTGAGSVVQLGRPYTKYTCMVTNISTTSPVGINMTVAGGITSGSLVTLGTYSITGLPSAMVSLGTSTTSQVAQPSFSFIRGTYTSAQSSTMGAYIRADCVATN